LWTYFTGPDITGGQVEYLSRSKAEKNGLVYVQGDNKTALRVDSWTNLPPGAPRNSYVVSIKLADPEGPDESDVIISITKVFVSLP
jgi:hypothetical protein